MSTTKQKNASTSKSTASASKKPLRSSKTRSSKSPATRATTKKGSSRSGGVFENGTSSLSTATDKKAGKSVSESSQPESSRRRKKDVWAEFDHDELPELDDDQLASFRRVSAVERKKLAAIDSISVLQDGETVEHKKVGRPKKSAYEKEAVRSIRLSEAFLERLKARAQAAGYAGWQTYAKKLLEDALNA